MIEWFACHWTFTLRKPQKIILDNASIFMAITTTEAVSIAVPRLFSQRQTLISASMTRMGCSYCTPHCSQRSEFCRRCVTPFVTQCWSDEAQISTGKRIVAACLAVQQSEPDIKPHLSQGQALGQCPAAKSDHACFQNDFAPATSPSARRESVADGSN